MTQSNIQIQVEVDQRSGAVPDLGKLLTRLSSDNVAQFMKTDVQSWLQHRADLRFALQGDDASGAWLPLQPATQSIRSAMGYGSTGPINVRTGEMKDFILSSSPDVTQTGDGAELIFPERSITPAVAEKMTTAQIGRSSPATQPRPVVVLNQTDETQIVQKLSDYLTENLVSRSIP